MYIVYSLKTEKTPQAVGSFFVLLNLQLYSYFPLITFYIKTIFQSYMQVDETLEPLESDNYFLLNI